MWACWCHMATCLAFWEGSYIGLAASSLISASFVWRSIFMHFRYLGAVQAVQSVHVVGMLGPFPLKCMVLFLTGFKQLVTAAKTCVLVRKYVASIRGQTMLDARWFFVVFWHLAPLAKCRQCPAWPFGQYCILEFLDSWFLSRAAQHRLPYHLVFKWPAGFDISCFWLCGSVFLGSHGCLDFPLGWEGMEKNGIVTMIGD